MIKGIFITGTDTGIGKTIIAGGIAAALKNRSIDIGVMKPFETGISKNNGKWELQDGRFLKEAAQVTDNDILITPYCFENPLAPYAASKLEKSLIDIKSVYQAFDKLISRHKLIVVEGAGGLLVPIKKDYHYANLAKDLNLPVIIVAGPGLGTINHTLLTIQAAQSYKLNIIGIVFNNYSGNNYGRAENTNPGIIKEFSDIPILGEIPFLSDLNITGISKTIEEKIDIESIISFIQKDGQKLPLFPPAAQNESSEKRPGMAKEAGYGNPEQRRNSKLERTDKKYIWHPFTQMGDWQKETLVIIERGEGNHLIDTRGNRYLDGVSSLWTTIHGHNKKEINEAIINQTNKISHSTLLGLANIPSIELARKLIRLCPMELKKIFYSDNGSTAVEAALKIAIQYWDQRYPRFARKKKFISLENAYHGDTLGAVGVGGISLFHRTYKHIIIDSIKVPSPHCYRCHLDKEYPDCDLACADELEKTVSKEHEHIAALVIEPIMQGAAGMFKSPIGYLKRARKICSKYNILMIADEVATGFGRTGKMFACEHEMVSPDILCLAKGITGGYLPLAATITTEEIYNAFCGEYSELKTLFHGHTYTGNPVACSAAIANIDIFEKEKTLIKLQRKIKLLKEKLSSLEKLDHVGEIRQAGFMVGIELVMDRQSKKPYPWQEKTGAKVIMEARKMGVILRPLGNVIVLMPPLSITEDELALLVNVVEKSIIKVTE